MSDFIIDINNKIIAVSKDGIIKKIDNIKLDNNFIWININNSNELIDELNIHPITLEDINETSENVIEKMEIFNNYIYIILKNSKKENINILLYKNFILTINHINLEDIKNILNRCKNNIKLDVILHSLIDYLIDGFYSITYNLVNDVDKLDNEIVTDIIINADNHKKKISKVNKLKRIINFYYRTLITKKNIIQQLTNKNYYNLISKETLIYFQDVNDNIIIMYDRLCMCKENIIQCQNNYTSLLSLEAAISSEKTNIVMKQLSSVATIMLPMTVIVGLFGMNVKVPGQNYDSLVWFYGITSLLSIIVIILIILFRKLKYF